MAVYNIFSECPRCNYKTTICSKATVFIILTTIFTFIFPLLIAYRSHGFWLKSSAYQEQPEVHFKHEYLLIVETDELQTPILCSTFSNFNQVATNVNHCSMFKSRENDINKDGKYDELLLEIEIQPPTAVSIHSVKLLLFFNYKLHKFSSLHMESMGVIQHSSSLAGARLDVAADLRLVQKQLLHSQGRDIRFNNLIIDPSSFPELFSLQTLLSDYSRRNVSTHLHNVYALWTPGRPLDASFIISVVIYYPEDNILYSPGFWQVMKWAWIQYLAVLIVSVYIFRTIKSFVFSNQLVTTVKVVPWKKSV